MKFRIRRLELGHAAVERFRARQGEYREDWGRNLLRLLGGGGGSDFDTAWRLVNGYLESEVVPLFKGK